MILCSLLQGASLQFQENVFFDVSDDQFFVKGIVEGTCEIPGDFLNNGSYYISIIFVENSSKQLLLRRVCRLKLKIFENELVWTMDGYVFPETQLKL
jgi:lipopolysaccharide transport system ATP-binding protein